MKKFTFICSLAMLFAAGCSKEDFSLHPAAEGDWPVEVAFRMEALPDTDTSLEPMTRTTAYVNWMSNRCRALIIRKTDGRWIVEGTQTVLLDADAGEYAELKLPGGLPPSSFRLEMRPGDYHIVIVTNPSSVAWNAALKPGTVVDTLAPPPLATYRISDHWMNDGLRMLNREIFVAVADFTVPKSGDLHASGMQPVALQAERRVGKFRVLLKNTPSPKGRIFDNTAHTFKPLFRAVGRPFAEGIDALGEMYYSEQGLYELRWCTSTVATFHPSGGAAYQMSQTNSTVFSPFLFADPAKGEQTFEISDIIILGASGGFNYETDRVFTRTLAASKITGIVFRTTDRYDDSSGQQWIGIEEATDAKGDPERAERLFDAFYEWNAVTNY